ncbi:MAG: hypothetical protein HY287_02730 [Planctomycetes bacterium]|nr:hypothetical protein [Planctomycetota bacterium]MBI3833226.1 hypothetical protein [Planctomycetota bacterium]
MSWKHAVITGSILCGLTVPAFGQADVVEVTVTGEGISDDSAKNDALRKALEQGGGAEISSHSNVENFQLVRDTIYARADGIVKDFKILEKGDGAGGTKFCKIKALVSKTAIASTWGEVQNVLDQIGRPKIAIYILERIDGVIQDSSILESQIENKLLAAGFDLKSRAQIDAIAQKELADASAENNVAKMQAIAKNFGAQIFITGTAQANNAGIKELAGEPAMMYNGDGNIKMFYTDSAQLLASESLPNWRGGARGYANSSPQAGKKALEGAGQELVDRCYVNVMKQWATHISAGGEITLEVEGMNMADAIKLKKKIQDIDPDKIKNVNQTLSKGTAVFRIKAKMTGEELSERLVGDEFKSLLEIVDLSGNRIQAKKPGA